MILTYEAIGSEGQRTSDTIEATDSKEAVDLLRRRGLFVTRIEEQRAKKAVQTSAARSARSLRLPLKTLMLVTRQMAKETDPIALQAVSGVMASVVLVPLLALGSFAGLPELSFAAPQDAATAWLLLGIGLLGTGAHLLMTWSLRYAPSATLAPMQYLEIPVATLIGWMIFRDLPDGLAALGICITIAAGLYVILRERANARPAPSETPA